VPIGSDDVLVTVRGSGSSALQNCWSATFPGDYRPPHGPLLTRKDRLTFLRSEAVPERQSADSTRKTFSAPSAGTEAPFQSATAAAGTSTRLSSKPGSLSPIFSTGAPTRRANCAPSAPWPARFRRQRALPRLSRHCQGCHQEPARRAAARARARGEPALGRSESTAGALKALIEPCAKPKTGVRAVFPRGREGRVAALCRGLSVPGDAIERFIAVRARDLCARGCVGGIGVAY